MSKELKQKGTFLEYINNFRGFAMILIVAIHMYHELYETNPIAFKLLNIIFANSSVVFVFISGFLFQHLLTKYEYKSYLKRKFLFIILPYFFMSIPALILTLYDLPYAENHLDVSNFQSYNIIKKIILLISTGSHQAQLWFIPMIAIMFLFTIALKYIDKNPKFYLLLPLLLIVAVILGRHNYKPFLLFIYFLPVYMFGMFISRYKEKIFEKLTLTYIAILTLAFLILSALYYYTHDASLLLFQKLLMAVLSLLFLKQFPEFLKRFLQLIADYSFGIYFIHLYAYFLLTHIVHTVQMDFLFEGIFGFIFKLSSVLIISIGVIKLIRIIFGKRSRYIVGC